MPFISKRKIIVDGDGTLSDPKKGNNVGVNKSLEERKSSLVLQDQKSLKDNFHERWCP
jgi:hypothetical protein